MEYMLGYMFFDVCFFLMTAEPNFSTLSALNKTRAQAHPVHASLRNILCFNQNKAKETAHRVSIILLPLIETAARPPVNLSSNPVLCL
jgi:hypothetical protein